eukprot:gene20847-27680_t
MESQAKQALPSLPVQPSSVPRPVQQLHPSGPVAVASAPAPAAAKLAVGPALDLKASTPAQVPQMTNPSQALLFQQAAILQRLNPAFANVDPMTLVMALAKQQTKNQAQQLLQQQQAAASITEAAEPKPKAELNLGAATAAAPAVVVSAPPLPLVQLLPSQATSQPHQPQQHTVLNLNSSDSAPTPSSTAAPGPTPLTLSANCQPPILPPTGPQMSWLPSGLNSSMTTFGAAAASGFPGSAAARPAPPKPKKFSAPAALSPEQLANLPWKSGERDALRKGLMLYGVGKWNQSPTISNDDAAFLDNLLKPIEARGNIVTPGAPFTKAEQTVPTVIKRLRLMDDFIRAMEALKRPAVKEHTISLLKAMPDNLFPASWWSVDADLTLLDAIERHGYGTYEVIRQDKDYDSILKPVDGDEKNVEKSILKPVDGDEANLPAEKAAPAPSENGDTGEDGGEGGEAKKGVGKGKRAPLTKGWPVAEVLTKRFRRVLDIVFRAINIEAGLEEGPAHTATKVEPKASTSGSFVPSKGNLWGRKDRLELVRVLMTWGLPTPSLNPEPLPMELHLKLEADPNVPSLDLKVGATTESLRDTKAGPKTGSIALKLDPESKSGPLSQIGPVSLGLKTEAIPHAMDLGASPLAFDLGAAFSLGVDPVAAAAECINHTVLASVASAAGSDMWALIRTHCPMLASKSDESMAAAYADILEEMTEIKKHGATSTAVDGLSHPGDCTCVICNNRRKKAAKRQALALFESGGLHSGMEDQAGASEDEAGPHEGDVHEGGEGSGSCVKQEHEEEAEEWEGDHPDGKRKRPKGSTQVTATTDLFGPTAMITV